MIQSYYLAKILSKLQIASFNHCHIDKTAKVDCKSALTRVRMGRYSYAGSSCRITDAEIGSFCSIGSDCGIGGGVHPIEAASTSPVFLKGRNILGKNFANRELRPNKSVIIGNDVWIGDGVFIKEGITIGNGAVIGAHAVVTKNVEPYSIVAGVPAREIRKRFPEDIINELQTIQWWEWDEDKLSRCGECFESPEKLIEWNRKETV